MQRAGWMAVGMERPATATSSRSSCRVSIRATMQTGDETTYQCCLSHPQRLQIFSKTSLGRDVNAEQRFHLKGISQAREVELEVTYLGVLDAHSQCDRCGNPETELDGRRHLLPSARERGSTLAEDCRMSWQQSASAIASLMGESSNRQ